MNCPRCGTSAWRVIYLGLPMWLCPDDGCVTVFGFWSRVTAWLPIASYDEHGQPAFAFMPYEGWYLPALWLWLMGAEGEDTP